MRSEPSTRYATGRTAGAGPGAFARRHARALHVAAFILLALIAVQTARLGAAGLFVQLGQNETDAWPAAPRSPSAAELGRGAKYFADGLDYVSDYPWALEGAGATDLARMRASTRPREALAAAEDAHRRFREALQLRPTSPFLWANIALTKLYLDEIDAELFAALRHADELGPWEPTVQRTILFVGLARWADLAPDLKQMLLQTIRRGADRDARNLFEIAKSYTRLDLVCAIEEYRRIAGSACDRAAQTVKPGAAGT